MLTGKWTVYYRWASTGQPYYLSMALDFKAQDTFKGKDFGKAVTGKWVQHFGTLSFQFNDSKCTYTGANTGSRCITGTMTAFDDPTQVGDFYMIHDSHSMHIAKKSDLAKTPAHRDATGRQIF